VLLVLKLGAEHLEYVCLARTPTSVENLVPEILHLRRTPVSTYVCCSTLTSGCLSDRAVM
jgi:hypothetical protein